MLAVLALLVIVAIVVFGVAMSRHRVPGPHGDHVAQTPPQVGPRTLDTSLPAGLNRAVARGQLSREIADSILAAEAAEALAGAPQPVAAGGARVRTRRVATPTIEALGYLGSILALVGVGFLVGRSWNDIGQVGRIGLLGGLAALLLVVGLLLRDEDEAVIWRLRNFVLLLSTGALAGCTGVVAVDSFGWRGEPVSISIGLVAAVYSALLWARRDRPAQHVTTMVGTVVALGASMGWWGGPAAVGVTTLVVSAAWILLARNGLVVPGYVGSLLGLAGVLVGPAITSGPFGRWAPALGLAVALVLLVLGARLHEFGFTGFGVVGLLGYLTFGVARWFGNSLKAPGVLVVSGIALLIATLVLVRRGRSSGGLHGPRSGLIAGAAH